MSTTTRKPISPSGTTTRRLVAALGSAAAAWAGLYWLNTQAWDVVLGDWLGVDLTDRVGGAIHFFAYDTVKILLLLVGLIFAVGMLRTTVRPERVRDFLAGRGLVGSLVLAALFGAITPFCSCSSIPLFIGFVAAGVPIAVTLTFLIASPLINEVAVVMLGDLFGWEVTTAYVGAGLALAIGAGWLLSRFRLDRWVADFVRTTPVATLAGADHRSTLAERVDAARSEVRNIVGRIWPWVVVGVGIGAAVHGWVPTDFFADHAGPDDPFAVVVATVAGVPIYSNAAGIIPIAEALWAKGMATGTVMAFMMSTVALSLPELVLLKRVLKTPLLAIFVGVVTLGILIIGFGANAAFG